MVTLEGVVERIVYENAESGFLVARMQVAHAPELTTFVGNMLAINPGETVRLRGHWVEDKRFGRQLKVASCETILPSSVDGIEKYLGSGLIDGVGPAYAKRLVTAFGVETLRVIEEEPERLRKVPGIGKKRAKQIREAWAEQKAVQGIMVFLQGHGIAIAQAVKIYQCYGQNALTVLRENPYRLVEDITGIGFKTADAIAQRLGMPPDAPVRTEAGILHALRETASQGHVYATREALLNEAQSLLSVDAARVEHGLAQLVARERAILEEDRCYLPPLHTAETGASEFLKRLVATPYDGLQITKVDNAVNWAEKHLGIQLSPEQQTAIKTVLASKVTVITGGPGTGKTTVLKSLLAIVEKKGQSFLLAAPTGRAAKRIEETTGRDARTIHRLLEFSPKSGVFTRNEHDPVITDLVVIDESSMIDVLLFHALLKAVPPFAKLVLVGDVDQLPSVGAGNVLFDVIASGAVPVVRLETVFRQAEESGIIANAHRINTGQTPHYNDRDFFLIERAEPLKTLDTVIELVTSRIPQRFGLDPLRQIQVLSPMRRGDAGVNRLNEALQEAMNPRGEQVGRSLLRKGDKVMQLRNNYELDVYNGDMGIISLADNEARELEVTFEDDRKVLYSYDLLDNLGLAYATTIHKSQGSEYEAVVVAFMTQHYMMLQRNVLYTGVTRGKSMVVIVGQERAVHSAVKNNHISRRNTRLAERLRNVKPGA
ncbi:MAG: ATP-dependent RecD-like DNA helicase [Candidatus Hydrogenedentes bacterium]|nr:ATP-dependent RecD-like DNA helicase [Candidatus Hydrogenedentota bacterium]